MKTNFLIKLVYILFMLFGIQLAYASSTLKKLSFVFNYGQGIDSIYFDQTNMESKHTYPSATFKVTDASNSYSYTLTVQSEIGSSGADYIANDFNKKSPRMEVGGSATSASSLDFMFDGVLKINRRPIGLDHSFVIGHENYKSSNADWWIANTSSNSSLYGSGTSASITVQDDIGNYYCLRQLNTNYQIKVSRGPCSYPYFPNIIGFTFIYGRGVESIEYDNSYNADPTTVGFVYSSATTSQLIINVSGSFNDGEDWEADLFNKTFNFYKRMVLNDDKLFSINTADATDIYIAGTLKINGNNLMWNSPFALAHEYDSHNWIIATNAGGYKDGSTQFMLRDLYGKFYCMKQNGTNFQVIVDSSPCKR